MFILGTKQNMEQVWDEAGKCTPVTVLNADSVTVVQIKTVEKDGYIAIVVAFGERNERNINKSLKGKFKDTGNFRYLKEFIVSEEEAGKLKVGDKIETTSFSEGDIVQVSGVTKGKGFQGVVKRHGFHGGRRSHGQKHSEREPGSIGATGPQRVFKGVRMGGRMGSDRVTVKNLKVVGIDKENGQMMISGALPGKRGTLLEVRSKVA